MNSASNTTVASKVRDPAVINIRLEGMGPGFNSDSSLDYNSNAKLQALGSTTEVVISKIGSHSSIRDDPQALQHHLTSEFNTLSKEIGST